MLTRALVLATSCAALRAASPAATAAVRPASPADASLRAASPAAGDVALRAAAPAADWRALSAGVVMLADLYLDQPNVAVIPHPSAPSRSRWVATITRNSAPEGHRGEHVECLYSDDAGASWSAPVKLEPGAGTVEGLTNAYSAILLTDFGRLYVTYNLNLANVTHFPDGRSFTRDDTQGSYVVRWSDDAGVSWSAERVVLPWRQTAIDRSNVPFNGSTVMFWSVDQYKSRADGDDATVYLGFTKIGTYAYTPPEESFLWSSPNMRTERNASAIVWNTLPAGDVGIASVPARTLVEETHVLPLSAAGGGGVFVLFRTDQGHLGAASTRDPTGAAGWSASHAASFWAATPAAAALGAVMRNPRGPITARRLPGGRWLLLWYNNGEPVFYERNPYWLSVGVEDAASGEVRFSQPEIYLYDVLAQGVGDNYTAADRPGYPDIVVDESARSPSCPACTVFVTETNKTISRTHGIPPAFLSALLAQDTAAAVAAEGLAIAFDAGARGKRFATPPIAAFAPANPFQAGFAVDFWLARWAGGGVAPGQALLDSRAPATGAGFAVLVAPRLGGGTGATLALEVRDDAGTAANLTLDARCASLLAGAAPLHHVAFSVDAAAHIMLAVVDGFVCDGGADKLRGWAWVPANATSVTPSATFVWGGTYGGTVAGGRWYSRALSVSDCVGNARAGAGA